LYKSKNTRRNIHKMRSGLVIFGVIFLVIGVFLFLVPVQRVNADVNNQAASASVTVPVAWAYSIGTIGLILLIIGLAAGGPTKEVKVVPVKVAQGARGPRGPRGKAAPRRRRSVRSPRRSSTVARSTTATLPKGTSVTTTTRIKRTK
jgi:hypothetical protein